MPETAPTPALPTFAATRYVQPLREGGSLPAVVETDEGGLFVVKFRGAGQGAKVLVAELIVGLLAQRVGLPVPELALVEVSDRFGRSEPDPEIQDLLRNSHGVNVGLRYLDGAFNYDGVAAGELVDAELAARIVWLDALVTNPDRTARNPNLLVWQRRPWLIDHGAALYAQHDWASVDEARTRTPFPLIERHVLLGRAGDLAAADAQLAPLLDDAAIARVLALVPDALLVDPVSGGDFPSAAAARARYVDYLRTRLQAPRAWVEEAVRAQARLRAAPPRRLEARR
ncbi:MAG TPA: HipA family kinase [Gemmatimonadaceae bacterium]|nr:HipA family kinase [Gemmatimonadaceae bacterium]